MTNFEKENLTCLVEQVQEGLKDHDLFRFKYDNQYPCSVTTWIPYDEETQSAAYVYIHSVSTNKGKYLNAQELCCFAMWLDELNYVEGTIHTLERAYNQAKDELVKKVAAWVN